MPDHIQEIQRSELLGARIRFSPTGANVRENSIDRILLQNLAFAGENGYTVEEVLSSLRTSSGAQILNIQDVELGISHLSGYDKLIKFEINGKAKYKLNQTTYEEVVNSLDDAQKNINDIVADLFGPASGKIENYKSAFLELLGYIFSRMSTSNVSIIIGSSKEHTDVHKLILEAIQTTVKKFVIVDNKAFAYGVNRFFGESTPLYDTLKWNMAQNYYIIKALGIDKSTQILSSDILNGSILYLDTNVLIAGLIPNHRNYNGIIEAIKACRTLNITVKITQITMQELRRIVIAHSTSLSALINKIPTVMWPKVHSFILESYIELCKTNKEIKLDNYIEQIKNQVEEIMDEYEIEDDVWFVNESDTSTTKMLAKKLIEISRSIRPYQKREAAATHDALMLRWIEEKQKETNPNSRLVTLDYTLVEKDKEPDNTCAHVLTLDALLQWTTPQCNVENNIDHLAAIYSASLKYQLLPSEPFFDIRDFQVFADMGIETGQLPVDDVEACIREIRKLGPSINPNKAEDREKIAVAIHRYFADPGTKFNKMISELKEQNKNLGDNLDKEIQARVKTETELHKMGQQTKALEEHNKILSNDINEEKTARSIAELKMNELEERMGAIEKEKNKKKIRNSIIIRTVIIGLPYMIFFIAYLMVALHYGDGTTWFVKITNGWPIFLSITGIFAVIFWLIMGRDRMRYLKWWKGEAD